MSSNVSGISYDDLKDAPNIPKINNIRPEEFNPIAFTGLTNNILVPIMSNIINLNNYNGSIPEATTAINSENNNKLHNLNKNSYILSLSSFTNSMTETFLTYDL